MLADSSKRAISSTTTATCLPFWAASSRYWMICELAEVRYRVILMPSTLGSVEASRRNRSTELLNDS